MESSKSNKNFVLFITLTLVIFLAWVALPHWLGIAPKKQPEEKKAEVPKEQPKVKDDGGKKKEPGPAELIVRAARLAAQAALQPPAPPRTPRRQLTLGDASSNLQALLDTRGGGVRRVVLTKFQQANRLGQPEWREDSEGNPLKDEKGNKVPQPLELIREDLNQESGSYLLYHFTDKKSNEPVPTLGEIEWNVVEEGARRVAFATEVGGVRITKIFTLEPEDYHLGLEVRLERLGDDKGEFRYQLTSAHGLRIEGEWYTNVLRNALVGWKDTKKDVFSRTLEEARQINFREGGAVVEAREGEKQIRYGGVAVQYFASMVVVDDQQENLGFLARARPTLERAAMKGRIKHIDLERRTVVLAVEESTGWFSSKSEDRLFYLGEHSPPAPSKGTPVAVVYRLGDQYDEKKETVTEGNETRLVREEGLHKVVVEFRSESTTEPLFYNDVLVRLATGPIELKAGTPVVHKYLLYNGPVKARLLGQLGGDKAVPQELVYRYEHTLDLNTLTDYATYGFFDTIGWTWLLIKCTNLMHSVLWALHTYIMPWSWGLCIIMLTVLVRGMMFPVSRKQALNAQRMQDKMAKLKPELAKLQEKYKNDREALGRAQMEMYRKYGINPLGSCWLVFLQMPIFLGLYYSLQESIHFRLAPFWPWIENLGAPDMLIWWGEQIPWISMPSSYGGMLYLGPFFNLLPVIAVAFMIMQQSMMTPPAMDEQQEMQMKMMKYMMVIFGLMFYKVAAGLCIYFIASSLWGLAERKLLPKRQLPDNVPADYREGFFDRLRKRVAGLGSSQEPATAVTTTPSAGGSINGPIRSEPASSGETPAQRRRGRRKRRGGQGREDGAPTPADGAGQEDIGKVRSWWVGLREWWADILEQAKKK